MDLGRDILGRSGHLLSYQNSECAILTSFKGRIIMYLGPLSACRIFTSLYLFCGGPFSTRVKLIGMRQPNPIISLTLHLRQGKLDCDWLKECKVWVVLP